MPGFSDILAGLAPVAGGFLGNLFGGEKGAQIGQGLGSMAGNMFGGGQQSQQAPQPQMSPQ